MRAGKKYDLPEKRRANNDKTNETTVAVYLEKNNYRIRFIPAGVSFESDTSPGMKPVYVRMFSEFLLALGYYKVLCMLSRESIEEIISDSHSEPDAEIAASEIPPRNDVGGGSVIARKSASFL